MFQMSPFKSLIVIGMEQAIDELSRLVKVVGFVIDCCV